jgi:hypothetical protein
MQRQTDRQTNRLTVRNTDRQVIDPRTGNFIPRVNL